MRDTAVNLKSNSKLRSLGERLVTASLLKGDFLLSSGKRSTYYFDKYLFETKPDLLRDVSTALPEEIQIHNLIN